MRAASLIQGISEQQISPHISATDCCSYSTLCSWCWHLSKEQLPTVKLDAERESESDCDSRYPIDRIMSRLEDKKTLKPCGFQQFLLLSLSHTHTHTHCYSHTWCYVHHIKFISWRYQCKYSTTVISKEHRILPYQYIMALIIWPPFM